MTEERAATSSEPSVPRGVTLVCAAAVGLTVLMAAPVMLEPSARLFGSRETFGGDDASRDALAVIEQLRSGRVSSPYLQPLTDLPARALARLVGPVGAYNLLILSSFPLSAAAAYLLARHVVGTHLAAMVAGLAYAFLPFHVAHAAGHPHVAQTQWLPLYFLALWRCLDRPDLRRASFLLAAAAAVVLSNFYGGLIAAVLSPVALIAYGVVSPRQPAQGRWRRLALTGSTLAAAAVGGLLLIHLAVPAVLPPGTLAFPRSDLFLHSAKWWSYLVPSVDHPLAAARVREFWAVRDPGGAVLEQQVGLGWSLLALAAVPLWLWVRGERHSLAVRGAPVLAILACAALLCSLSPERRIDSFTFVRPSALVYEVAPMFRAYARFGVVVGLMTVLLAGAGAHRLWLGSRSARRACGLLLGLAVLEFAPFPPWRWRHLSPTGAHRWLAAQPGPLRMLECPSPPSGARTLALAAGGEIAWLGAPAFGDCGEPQLADKLAALGYTHVALGPASAAGAWLSGQPLPGGLGRGAELEDGRILLVTAERPRAYVGEMLGFEPREYGPASTWRWMGQTGGLRIVATRASPGTALEVAMTAFPAERRVEWFLDARRLGELVVAAEWRWYELPLGSLPPGDATLTLGCREPAVVANDILHNGDPRALCLAVGGWRIKTDR